MWMSDVLLFSQKTRSVNLKKSCLKITYEKPLAYRSVPGASLTVKEKARRIVVCVVQFAH